MLQSGYTSKRICHLCEAKDARSLFNVFDHNFPEKVEQPQQVHLCFCNCSLLVSRGIFITYASRVLIQDWVDLSQPERVYKAVAQERGGPVAL